MILRKIEPFECNCGVSEERFRHLFDSSPDPVWIIEAHHFVECNQAAADILGFSDTESLKHTHPSTLSPTHQPDGEVSHDKAERMMQIAQEKGHIGSSGCIDERTARSSLLK